MPVRLRNPKKDMLWISAADPLANMVLGLISGIFLRLLLAMAGVPDRHSVMGLLIFMVFMSLQINLALAIFNIFPIAPLANPFDRVCPFDFLWTLCDIFNYRPRHFVKKYAIVLDKSNTLIIH